MSRDPQPGPTEAKQAADLLRQQAGNDPPPRWLPFILALTLALVAIAGLFIADRVGSNTQTVTQIKRDAVTKKEIAPVRKRAAEADRRSIRNTQYLQGKRGAPGAGGTRGAPGQTGTAGRDAPLATADQIRAITGPFVQAAVTDALAAFCGETCEGAPGAPGASGSDGAPGHDAAPVTAEQRAADQDAYCAANDGCRGPKGDTGDTGAQGPAGPPGPTVPCTDLDPALGYACTTPPPNPPTTSNPTAPNPPPPG